MLIQKGVLLQSDEGSVVFFQWLDENCAGPAKFIIRVLDGRTLLVKEERMAWLRERLADRMRETTYDEDEEDAAAAAVAEE